MLQDAATKRIPCVRTKNTKVSQKQNNMGLRRAIQCALRPNSSFLLLLSPLPCSCAVTKRGDETTCKHKLSDLQHVKCLKQ